MPKRTETGDWMKLFTLLVKLAPSPAIQEAGRAVFHAADDAVEAATGPATKSILSLKRTVLVHEFMARYPGKTAAAVYRKLRIDKAEWYRWARGEVKDDSCVAQRIDGYLKQSVGKFSPHSPH